MEKIYFNNNKSYTWEIPVQNLLDITPFHLQRNLDETINQETKTNRIDDIMVYLQDKLRNSKFSSFNFTTPLILVKSKDRSDLLLDKNGNRCYACIVDGQHRLEALKLLHKQYNNIARIKVLVVVHLVENMAQADEIQYDLFEQKPFDGYEKIKKSDYDLPSVIELAINNFRKDYGKNIRDNTLYSKKGTRVGRSILLTEELKKSILNSPNVKLWIDRQIEYTELIEAIECLMDEHFTEFSSKITIKARMEYIKIKTMPKKTKFNKMEVLLHYYYRNYQQLVNDIEDYLGMIEEVESEYESVDSDSN